MWEPVIHTITLFYGPPTQGYVLIIPKRPEELEISVTAFYPLTATEAGYNDLRRLLAKHKIELQPPQPGRPFKFAKVTAEPEQHRVSIQK